MTNWTPERRRAQSARMALFNLAGKRGPGNPLPRLAKNPLAMQGYRDAKTGVPLWDGA